MDTNTYQSGSLEKRQTALGPCWFLRFRERSAGAPVSRPRIRIGLLADYPSKASARRAADHLRKDFNESPKTRATATAATRYFRDLVEKYKQEEMPQRFSTAKSYRSYLDKHIMPRWGDTPISAVRPADVRDWLRGLELSPRTCGHIRDVMRILFRFAMLWEWIPLTINPITIFQIPGATKRKAAPRSLSTAEFAKLVAQLKEPVRTMVLVCGCLGLRCSELFALQWEDFDWHENKVQVRRSIVDGRADKVKTHQSEKALPLHPALAALLLSHMSASQFKEPDDWVFASPHSVGVKPYHPYRVQQYQITPAAAAAGLGTSIGWHTFRHSYRSWLGDCGTEPEVQRDLMRHADIRTTLGIYGTTFAEPLRLANEKIVGHLIGATISEG